LSVTPQTGDADELPSTITIPVLPACLLPGSYYLMLYNSDCQAAMLLEAFTVSEMQRFFLLVVMKSPQEWCGYLYLVDGVGFGIRSIWWDNDDRIWFEQVKVQCRRCA
jgi:hypothetical protein